MAFVTGLMLIDAPASALNNAGQEEGARTDNTIAVKRIRTRTGDYPYVSAQAVRYWLRSHLESTVPHWIAAPVFREAKIAYTDANPLLYWDDDLFGYMRAPSRRSGARSEETQGNQTPIMGEITRISPLRMSTFVSLAPVKIVDDFGTMARQDGDPVPHEHQFYRTHLLGLFSVNLTTAGTFFYGSRVGYRNLDQHREELARQRSLQDVTIHGQPAFRLPIAERTRRVATLIRAFGELEGGAKLTLHYTDVTPGLAVAAAIRGGNNPFMRIVRPDAQGQPEIAVEVLKEVLRVYKDQFVSDVFIGWAKGYLDSQRQTIETLSDADRSGLRFRWGHPREVMAELANELEQDDNRGWYD